MPSERAYPFARWSRVLHRPSDDSMPADAAPSVPYGTSFRLTASGKASAHSLARTAPCPYFSSIPSLLNLKLLSPLVDAARPPFTSCCRPHAARRPTDAWYGCAAGALTSTELQRASESSIPHCRQRRCTRNRVQPAPEYGMCLANTGSVSLSCFSLLSLRSHSATNCSPQPSPLSVWQPTP